MLPLLIVRGGRRTPSVDVCRSRLLPRVEACFCDLLHDSILVDWLSSGILPRDV